MNPAIDTLIRLAQSYGSISESQKQFIFQKANEYGEDISTVEEELSKILDGKNKKETIESISQKIYEERVAGENGVFKVGLKAVIIFIFIIVVIILIL